jgi:cyclophilin family peptidyl-prolyl cis-trans isomerase
VHRELRIFISYRRADATMYAGRLYESLEKHFSPSQLFMDIGKIAPGTDFVADLHEALANCDVLIAVIGSGWLVAVDKVGRRRLDNPDDFVRLELETALQRGITIIPVLVQGTEMPPSEDLPPSVSALTRKQALEISETRWRADVDRLIDALQALEKRLEPPPRVAPTLPVRRATGPSGPHMREDWNSQGVTLPFHSSPSRSPTRIAVAVLSLIVSVWAVMWAMTVGGEKTGAGTGNQSSPTPTKGSDVANAAALAAITCDDRKPETNTKRPTFDKPPGMTVDPTKRYTATLDTSCGKITADLDVKTAPKTVNNFVFLARKGFYDGLTWHRVAKDFVIQGGDPKGTGSGGPGYQFGDELPSDGYKLGSLAMANSGPDTNGSQFFIVTGSNGTALPNGQVTEGLEDNYSRFGQVTEGLEVAQKMESYAPDVQGRQDGPPIRPLYIFKVEITESAP